MIGPYAVEQDYSHYVSRSSGINFAVVGTASKGPVGVPTLCTSGTDLLRKFGDTSPEHLAVYAAKYYLSGGSTLYFVRAASSTTVPTKATATVTGTVSGTAGTTALTFTAVDPGTYYNTISIKVVKRTSDDNYNVVILSSDGIALETRMLDLSADPKEFISAYVELTTKAEDITLLATDAVKMTGGTDGTDDIEDSDYIAAGKKLSTDKVDMNLFAVPGVTSKEVITEMLKLAEDRGDCLFLVDPPKDKKTPDEVRTWHNGGDSTGVKLVSEYGALYYSWQYILDGSEKVLVPPSVVLGYTFATSARESEIWFPVAGVQRGLVQGVFEPAYAPDSGEVAGLYDDGNSVNCIINDPAYGLVVWGQKTLSRTNTATNRINVRMLINYLKRVVVSACKYLTFEPNDRITWNAFEDLVEPTLKDIGSRRGLYAYKIVKGEAIVTDDDIDNYRMPCKIMIQPTKAAEVIPIYFTITSTGADFNQILESEGIIEG